MNLEERVRKILTQYAVEHRANDGTHTILYADKIIQAFHDHVDKVVVVNPFHKRAVGHTWFNDAIQSTKDAIKIKE